MNYTTENPTMPSLKAAIDEAREGVQSLALDEERLFDDKVHALRASLEGEWRPFHPDPVVSKLSEAAGKLVLVEALSKDKAILVVGKMDEDKPWEFIDAREEDGRPRVGLQARFTVAQTISDTLKWVHESHHMESTRRETFPVAETTGNLVRVTLPTTPSTHNEFLYQRLQGFAGRSLHVGERAIHQAIADIQKDKTSDQLIALHAAASKAIGAIATLPAASEVA